VSARSRAHHELAKRLVMAVDRKMARHRRLRILVRHFEGLIRTLGSDEYHFGTDGVRRAGQRTREAQRVRVARFYFELERPFDYVTSRSADRPKPL
jgi:hypothetical protein